MTTTPTTWLDSFQVNTSATNFQGNQDIVGLSNGNFLVVFADDSGTVGTGNGRDIVGVIYDAEGSIVTTAFQVNTFGSADDEELPAIAATNDGGFVMAYEDRDSTLPTQQILLQRYNASGTSIDTAFVRSEPASALISLPKIAVNQTDNSMFVSFQWSDGNNDSIRGKRFDANLNPAPGTPTDGYVLRTDDFPSDFPGVINNNTALLNNGNFVTVFSEPDNATTGAENIEFVISNGTTGATSVSANVTLGTADEEIRPDVAALTGGGFVVVWREVETTTNGNDNGDNIQFARYSSTGALLGTITTVVDTGSEYWDPAVIGLEDGGFFVAAYDATSDTIEGTRFSATGIQIGANMATIQAGITNFPDIELSLTTDGRILLTYDDVAGNILAEILDPRNAGTITAEAGDQQTTARANENTTLVGVQTDSDTLFGQDGNDIIYGGDITGPGALDVLYGGDGNDYLDGGLFEDDVFGGLGNDTFNISSGNAADDVFGGLGNDTLDFSSSSLPGDVTYSTINDGTYLGISYSFQDVEVLIGNDFDRTWDLNFGTQSVIAGSGDDTFVHGTGEFVDNLDGGDGINTFDASGEDGTGPGSTGMVINNAAGTLSGQGGARTFLNFEIIRATQLNDTITGSSVDETLFGNDGNDTIDAGAGNDIVYGGDDNDVINKTNGSDSFFGGAGNDTINGLNTSDTDIVDGGAGTRDAFAVQGSGSQWTLANNVASAGSHTATLSGIEIFIGSNQADDIDEFNGAINEFYGGGGNDILRTNGINGSNETFDGGTGVDTLDYSDETGNITFNMTLGSLTGLGAATNFENVIGGSGNDTITGTSGANAIDGGAGADILAGNGGDDTYIVADDGSTNSINGSTSLDTIDVSGFTSAVTVGQNSGTNPTGNYDIVSGNGTVIENANRESKTLIATDFDDTINEFNLDVIYGGAGNDEVVVYQSPTSDEAYYGGAGTGDLLNLADGITGGFDNSYNVVNLSTGLLSNTGGAFGFENVIGTDGDSTIIGTGGANSISGADGNDTINPGFGNDIVYGGDEDDVINKSDGNDSFFGGAGNDTINGLNTADTDIVDGGAGTRDAFAVQGSGSEWTLANNVASAGSHTATLSGIEIFIGSNQADDIDEGNGAINEFYGGGGNDILRTNGINNINETFDGGSGVDTLDYSDETGNTTFNMTLGTLTGLGAATNFENVIGGSGNDTITGTSGDNTIDGGGGDDILAGGAGSNTYIVADDGSTNSINGSTSLDMIDVSGFTSSIFVGQNSSPNPTGDFNLVSGNGTVIENANIEAKTLIATDFDDVVHEFNLDVIYGGAGNDEIIVYQFPNSDEEYYGGAGTGDTLNLADGIGAGFDDDYGEVNLTTGVLTNTGGAFGFENVIGTEDADTITGTSGANSISGAGGNDTIIGLAGDDILYGGADDDIFVVADDGGATTIFGGSGTDLVDLSGSAAGWTISFFSGFSGPSTLINLNNNTGVDEIIGSDFDDDLQENFINSISAGAGDDIVRTNTVQASVEFFDGGAGLGDTLDFSTAAAPNTFNMATGQFTNTTGAFNFENAIGGGGNNTIIGTSGANSIEGGNGNDSIDGGAGVDLIYGGDGNDIIDDTSGADVVYGGDGNDDITSSGGDGVYLGEAGNDYMRSGIGAESMDGGTGIDTIDHSLYNFDYEFDMVTGLTQFSTPSFTEEYQNFENAVMGAGNDSVSGTGDANSIEGGTGNDTLLGLDGIDLLYGGEGNDTLNGGTEADAMYGGLGDDLFIVDNTGDLVVEVSGVGQDTVNASITLVLPNNVEIGMLTGTDNIDLTGNALENTLTGNSGNNQLIGLISNDTIFGGLGDDSIDGGAGADLIYGGDGNDTLSYESSSAGVTVSLSTGSASGGDSAGDTFTDFENLLGSEFNDVLTGDGLSNTLTGLAGNDTLSGGSGDDSLDGGSGNDWLNGGAGNDTMDGGSGNDRYFVDSTGDVVVEAQGGGTDNVTTSVDFTLPDNVEQGSSSGSADIAITGNALANFITGNAGNNTLLGMDGADRLIAGAGNDTLEGGTGNDILEGQGGENRFVFGPDNGDDQVRGWQPGLDQLDFDTNLGMRFADLRITSSGNEALISFDDPAGGTGSVRLVDVDPESLEIGILTDPDGQFDVPLLAGTTGGDNLAGTAAAEDLIGLAGNDTMNGRAGDDTMLGGFGNDRYFIQDIGDLAIEFAFQGEDQLDTQFSMVLPDHVERGAVLGGGAVDITGNELNNWITGSNLENVLIGGDGRDRLIGFGGDDTLSGGLENDVLEGGAGNDVFVFEVDGKVDLISDFVIGEDLLDVTALGIVFADLTILDGPQGALIFFDRTPGSVDLVQLVGIAAEDVRLASFIGAPNLPIIGTPGNDVLFGTVEDDELQGLGGNDLVSGLGGADVMLGGPGNDRYFVNNPGDVVTELPGEGTDQVTTSIDFTLPANVENLNTNTADPVNLTGNVLGNVLNGNNAANTLTGLGGDDNLLGNGGADVIIGGTGTDQLRGGTEADTFVFDTGDGPDTIIDFEVGVDTIDLSATGLTYGDLTIADVGANATVTYGADLITLLNTTAAQLDTNQFDFGP